MGLYNFKKQFAPFILEGSKTHTIRAMRAHPEKPGNMLHLYTGLRQKGATLLFRAPCVKVEEIEIEEIAEILQVPVHVVRVDGESLDRGECEALARRDGFRDFTEMMKFWDGRLPFKGHIIHWNYSARQLS